MMALICKIFGHNWEEKTVEKKELVEKIQWTCSRCGKEKTEREERSDLRITAPPGTWETDIEPRFLVGIKLLDSTKITPDLSLKLEGKGVGICIRSMHSEIGNWTPLYFPLETLKIINNTDQEQTMTASLLGEKNSSFICWS